MKMKLGLTMLIVIFLSGCQWHNLVEDISSQPSVNVPNQEEETTLDSRQDSQKSMSDSDDSNTLVDNQDEESVDCPVSATVNQAVDLLQLKISEKQLAAIIHEPSEEQLSTLDHLDVIEYKQVPNDERMLLIPQHIGSKVTIYEVMYEDDKFIEGTPFLKTQVIEDGQVIELNCELPEGIPHTKIVVEYKENRVEYFITYDGAGIRSQIEYLEYES